MMLFRNRYKSGVNSVEAIGKDVARWAWVLSRVLLTGRRPQVLLCFPDYPGSRTIIRKIARKLGLEISNRPERSHVLAMAYHDATLTSMSELSPLTEKALNYRCQDISKDTVDKASEEVLGYSTRVNPETYIGQVVEKSLVNAVHDGRIVTCPLQSPRVDAIYQVVIDNSVSENEFVDIRVPVIGNEVPLVYLKFKSPDKRFTNDTHRCELKNVQDCLSRQEVDSILSFSKRFGLDCGELDVLRDNTSGKIYIIDVNKTPYGPPAGLPEAEAIEAVQLLASAFKRQFLSKKHP